MRKIVEIELMDDNQVICHFNNGEVRILDLSSTINDRYASKILTNEAVFASVKVGDFGELYWPGVAEITDLDGKIIPCDYDISPEFAYRNSKPIKETIL